METELSRVVREYVLWVDGLEYSVKGRVCEIVDADPAIRYKWAVSHHYRPSSSASAAYYPSATHGRSVEEVEALMIGYLKNFTGIGVVKNGQF